MTKWLTSAAVSLGVLAALYAWVDVKPILESLRACDPVRLTLALGCWAPIIALTAWRVRALSPGREAMPLGLATQLVLSASVMNLFLPSKMGDVAKAAFMRRRGGLDGGHALALVVLEKALDMLGILAWGVFGLLAYHEQLERLSLFVVLLTGLLGLTLFLILAPGLGAKLIGVVERASRKLGRAGAAEKFASLEGGWLTVGGRIARDPRRMFFLTGLSLLISAGHLGQMWLLSESLEMGLDLRLVFGLMPLAVLAGLIPMTFAGAGTRDAAVVGLLAGYASAPAAAALGLLCTARYLVPALGGAPFFSRFLAQRASPLHDEQRPA